MSPLLAGGFFITEPPGKPKSDTDSTKIIIIIKAMCWGPLMDRDLVVWSRRSESKREKESDIPWFTQRTNKVLDTGLASLMKAPGALSRGS